MKKCLYREIMRWGLWNIYRSFNSMYFPLYKTWLGNKFLSIGDYFYNIRDAKYGLSKKEEIEKNNFANELINVFLEEEATRRGHKLNLIIEEDNSKLDDRIVMAITNIISLKDTLESTWIKIKEYTFTDYYINQGENSIYVARQLDNKVIARILER